jgi:hypothetical protein
MKILIENQYNFHYEILETVINKYASFFNIKENSSNTLILNINKNESFNNYIFNKYKNIRLCTINDLDVDYYINCSIYEKDINDIKNDDKHIYISHEVTENLKKYDNVYFLTPLCKTNKYFYANILPYCDEKIKSKIPIFIIQGNITDKRRNFKLLDKILNYQDKTNLQFLIKVVGKGKLDEKYNNFKKIIVKSDLNFENFHKEFQDAYCILPLITKDSHPQYYNNKLTSSINYGKAYKLKFLIDKDLQDIYNLENVEVFNNESDFLRKFIKCVNDYNLFNVK